MTKKRRIHGASFKAQRGKRCQAVTGNIVDMVPTMLELAGLPVPDVMDRGRTLVKWK